MKREETDRNEQIGKKKEQRKTSKKQNLYYRPSDYIVTGNRNSCVSVRKRSQIG